MQRAITGFHQDEFGDWVAELTCGHGQHMRHKPPFELRPWVTTAEGRASRLGLELGCVRCDRFELPAGFAPYKRTAEFSEATVPSGLRKQHSTRTGVWGVIHVLTGELRYLVEAPLASEQLLDPEHPGVVVPEVEHHVEPRGPVRFYVEFHRKAQAS